MPISLAIGLGVNMGGTVWSPASLFAAGEQGVWFDPSDFSTMFQDSAGTTPVTAVGQPVGKILDKSGRGNHATQATTANRPTLQQDASGYYYLSFNGTNSAMATGSIDFTATSKLTAWAGADKLSDPAAQVFCELSNVVGGNAGSFYIIGPDSLNNNNFAGASQGTTAVVAATAHTYPSPVSKVLTLKADIAAPLVELDVNGVSAAIATTTQGTGNFGNYPLYIGARGGTSLQLNGRIYSLIVRGATSIASQLTSANSFVGSRMGISL